MPRTNYAQLSRATQTQMARNDQVKNNAGGYVFSIAPLKQAERFLILGSDKPTYYQNAQELTRQNAQSIESLWASHPVQLMNLIKSITTSNRAPRKSPALFALALGTLATSSATRKLVYDNMHFICETASHLFEFLDYCEKLGKGWGSGFRRSVAKFFQRKDLGYQMIKYRQRNGFTFKRLFDLSHPSNLNEGTCRWISDKGFDLNKFKDELDPKIKMYELAKTEPRLALERMPDLPWEALPTEALNDPEVWKLLLPRMPVQALVRNLAKITKLELLKPLSNEEAIVIDKLTNKHIRIHPFNILMAKQTYQSGHGFRGSMVWKPNPNIVAALETAFYNSFSNIEPSGKRFLIGLDVSGSMGQTVMGTNISAAQAAAAMIMSLVRTEPRTYVFGFTNTFWDLGITKNDSLNEVLRKTSKSNFGTTDCAVPMVYAKEKKLEVDTFVVMTDNETYAGRTHPYQALLDYRKASGINSSFIVCGMTATNFSIADPRDEKSLDIVGLDSALPQLIKQF